MTMGQEHGRINGFASSHSVEYGLSPEVVARRLGGEKAQREGRGWKTCCPAHDDADPSLSVDRGKNGGLIVCCRVRCTQEEVIAAMERQGIGVAPPRETRAKPESSGNIAALQRKGWRLTRAYDYRDEDGRLLCQNARLEFFDKSGTRLGKTFRHRRPSPNGKGWTEHLGDVRRVPYRLPEIVGSAPDIEVHIPEGEKDADRLSDLGLIATSIKYPRKTEFEALRGRHAVIHEDNDQPGRNHTRELCDALAGIAQSVVVVRYEDAGPKADVSDWLDRGHGLEDLLKRVETARAETKATSQETAPAAAPADRPKASIEWPDLTTDEKPRNKSQANILEFLRWQGVTLRHNAFTLRDEITTRDGVTTELSDRSVLRLFLEAHELGLNPPKEFFEDVVSNAAAGNAYHPVRDYLAGLTWDGRPRLDRWLPTYAGAADTALVRAFGRKALLAAVRRVLRPGCKFDPALTLEGHQGVGKSSLIRVIAGDDWFTDCLSIGADPKTVVEQTAGAWLVEMPELSGIRKGEVEAFKAMLSRQSDRARLAYGKRTCDVPRQFVLIATINPDGGGYLRDVTGNRRYWPVKVGAVDLEALRRDRDQLWAEAAHYEAQRESLELPRELWEQAAAEQEARLQVEPWEEILAPLLEGKCGHIPTDVLWRRLDIKTDRQDGNMGRRLTQIMGRLGWTKTKRRHNGPLVPCFSNDPKGEWIGII
jgi:predicted P-loop ATPase